MLILFVSSYESGVLEDPAHEGPEDLYQMTKDPKTAPEQPDKLEITFKNGIWIVCLKQATEADVTLTLEINTIPYRMN